MKNIQLKSLILDLTDIKKSSYHKTWYFKKEYDGIKIVGNIYEISFNEIINLLANHYPTLGVQCFLNEKYIFIW